MTDQGECNPEFCLLHEKILHEAEVETITNRHYVRGYVYALYADLFASTLLLICYTRYLRSKQRSNRENSLLFAIKLHTVLYHVSCNAAC